MSEWTLSELVAAVAARIEALPAPSNGQVRAVPDERTVRYYGSLGLLDRPLAMRGRTALYGPRHLAQVVAIKRLQVAGKSLADIRALWPSIDDATLARMTGVEIPAAARTFWKSPTLEPEPADPTPIPEAAPVPASSTPIQVRIPIAPNTTLLVTLQLIQEPTR